jgi:hypothetical protein
MLPHEGLVECDWHSLRLALETALDSLPVRERLFAQTAPMAKEIKQEVFGE